MRWPPEPRRSWGSPLGCPKSEPRAPGSRPRRWRSRALVERRLVGPNCLGVVDTTTGLQLAHAVLPAGDVAVLSQSGNLVLDLAALLADRGLGVSRFVSLGNQADLGLVDFLLACVDHEGTRAVAVYAEDVVDGHAFLEAARALRDVGKPLVLLAPGRTDAAVRSAASHTGSLTTSSMVVDAACAAVGAVRVEHPTQMADLLAALRAPQRMAGSASCGAHRRGRARGGGGRCARGGRAADPGAHRRCHVRAPGGTVGARDGHQPRRPGRRGGPGRGQLRPGCAGAAGLRPGRRRAADGLLRWLLRRAVDADRTGGGSGSADRRVGRRPGEAARRPDDLSGEPRESAAGSLGHPRAPRHRPRVRGAGRTRRGSRRPVSPRSSHLPRRRSPTRRTPQRGRCSPVPASPSQQRDRSRILPGWMPRSPSCASLSCSRRWVACTSPRAAAWSSVSATRARRERRTTTWSRGSRHRPSLSRRWPTCSDAVELIVGSVQRPEVRRGRDGRARWRLHRGAGRHCLCDRADLGRCREDRCCRRCGALRCSVARAAGPASIWTPWPRWSPASPASRPPIRSWSSWSSTRCSRVPAAPWPWTREWFSAERCVSRSRRRAGSAGRSRAPRSPWPERRRGRTCAR